MTEISKVCKEILSILLDVNRTVAVDSRGMYEAIRKVYKATRLADELWNGGITATFNAKVAKNAKKHLKPPSTQREIIKNLPPRKSV
ncbi:MAG: S46 family peptidase [Ignavibacteriales bacterium]|nr:S46 family peptidase [Ignavibacteriales bacterium]